MMGKTIIVLTLVCWSVTSLTAEGYLLYGGLVYRVIESFGPKGTIGHEDARQRWETQNVVAQS